VHDGALRIWTLILETPLVQVSPGRPFLAPWVSYYRVSTPDHCGVTIRTRSQPGTGMPEMLLPIKRSGFKIEFQAGGQA
jgi:hypothetical protein